MVDSIITWSGGEISPKLKDIIDFYAKQSSNAWASYHHRVQQSSAWSAGLVTANLVFIRFCLVKEVTLLRQHQIGVLLASGLILIGVWITRIPRLAKGFYIDARRADLILAHLEKNHVLPLLVSEPLKVDLTETLPEMLTPAQLPTTRNGLGKRFNAALDFKPGQEPAPDSGYLRQHSWVDITRMPITRFTPCRSRSTREADHFFAPLTPVTSGAVNLLSDRS